MPEPKPKAKGGFKPPAAQPEKPRVNPGEGTIDDVKVTHLQVRSLVAGFRRAGRAWSTEEVTVDVAEFTAEQVEQLLAEPTLVVLPIAGEVAK
jgi:hypothetical protein